MDGKPLGVDEDPHANDDAKTTLQRIVWRLMQDVGGTGTTPEAVAGVLNQEIADAGLPEQPAPWVEATAIEIAGQREVVMDTQDEVEPEQVDLGDHTVNVLAAPTGIPEEPGAPRPAADDVTSEAGNGASNGPNSAPNEAGHGASRQE